MMNYQRGGYESKSLFSDYRQAPVVKENNGIVLDFLQHGHISDPARRPVAQLIGVEHLSLLEVAPKKDVYLKSMELVYIGIDKRDKIHHITRKIEFNDLTETAKMNLQSIVEEAVNKSIDKIVDFFNNSQAVSTRQHQLELIPGIGKKHMWAIIDEREKKPFSSIEDLKERVSLIPNPIKPIIKRAMDELEGVDKYKIILPRLDLSKVTTFSEEKA